MDEYRKGGGRGQYTGGPASPYNDLAIEEPAPYADLAIEEPLAPYTELAIEARDIAVKRTGGEIPGVIVDEEPFPLGRITRIRVKDLQAQKQIGKPPGDYITIESLSLRNSDREAQDRLSSVLGNELEKMIDWNQLQTPPGEEPTILVVGLGNWNATPDALGPRVVHHLMITRHLYYESPPELREGMRPVCGLAPGVLGITGIQTAEIIRGVVDKVRPGLLIVVDSLAANSTDRLGATIQLANTGINPGSGLGGKRMGINRETMGIPVIAVGVPTVVNAVTIANDSIEHLLNHPRMSSVRSTIDLNDYEKQQVIREVLQPFLGNLFLALKGVDELIQDNARVIAGGLNLALHPDINEDNLSLYLN